MPKYSWITLWELQHTSRDFRYTCFILVTYIGSPVNLLYGAGISASLDSHAGDI